MIAPHFAEFDTIFLCRAVGLIGFALYVSGFSAFAWGIWTAADRATSHWS